VVTPRWPTTQEVEVGESLFDTSLGKVSMRPCFKNKLKRMKGLGIYRSSARMLNLASSRPYIWSPVPKNKTNQNKKTTTDIETWWPQGKSSYMFIHPFIAVECVGIEPMSRAWRVSLALSSTTWESCLPHGILNRPGNFLFVCVALGFELRPTWATPPALFCVGFSWVRVSGTICWGWLQTAIILVSASCVNRITGVSHQHPADLGMF
jgi:hypothetical protein